MRFLSTIIIAAVMAAAACSGPSEPATPTQTFKNYILALKKNDLTAVKLMLSDGTIKMHEQEAKAQNVNLDDIVKRDTLVAEGQKTVEFRNEKIEGETATLEVKNAFGEWETVPFLYEEGAWKIDKKGYADRLMQVIDESTDQKIDEAINQGRAPTP